MPAFVSVQKLGVTCSDELRLMFRLFEIALTVWFSCWARVRSTS